MSEAEIQLAFCRDWFAAVLDGEEGINWMNGDSAKYAGDAWTEATRIFKRLKKIVGR